MSLRTLSLLVGSPLPVEAASDISDALERVEIDSAIGQHGTFRLAFRLDDPTLPERFLSESGDLPRIVLVLNETHGSSVLMDGVLVVHTLATSADSMSSLVVSGEDLTLLMDLLDVDRSFAAAPLQARVLLLLAPYTALGITPVVVTPPLAPVPRPGEPILQQGTDYHYLRSLADSIGFRFTLDPGPLPLQSVVYWGPEPRTDRSPSLSIDFARPAKVDTLRISFDANHRVVPEAVIVTPGSGVAVPMPVPDIATLVKPLGAMVPPAHRTERLRDTAGLTTVDAAAALLARAARSAEAMTGHGTLDVELAGVRLRAGAIVEVHGAARPFNGLYEVSRVRDTITADHHSQTFELLRAGVGAASE